MKAIKPDLKSKGDTYENRGQEPRICLEFR